MKTIDMEKRIQNAFHGVVPDILDDILSDCGNKKGNVIVMSEKKKTKPWVRRVAGLAAVLVLFLAGGAGYQVYDNNYAVASTVSLDVNPSIEIKVNQKERVLEVTPLNDDGKKVIDGMDFSGNTLDITVNAIIGSMLRNGYISELSNSILISVDNDDDATGTKLRDKLAGEIDGLLQSSAFNGAVLSQNVSADTALQQLADKNGITPGKAQLIQQIVDGNPRYNFEDLAKLSINELNLLGNSHKTQLNQIEARGTASDKAYIGVEKAKTIALKHAGVAAENTFIKEADLDTENGLMVYEIEFVSNGYEYSYDVNAKTGDVVKFDRERDDDYQQTYTDNNRNHSDNDDKVVNSGYDNSAVTKPSSGSTNPPSSYIGEAKAKSIALSHAGLSDGDIRDYEIDLDHDDGTVQYEIDFNSGSYDYSYDIDAVSGKIVKSDKEFDD